MGADEMKRVEQLIKEFEDKNQPPTCKAVLTPRKLSAINFRIPKTDELRYSENIPLISDVKEKKELNYGGCELLLNQIKQQYSLDQ